MREMKTSNNQNNVEPAKKQAVKPRTDADKPNTFSKIQGFIEDNSKKVAYISLGIVGATVLFFLIRYFVEKSAEDDKTQASVEISRILPFYNNYDYKHALYGDSTHKIRDADIIGFIEISERHSGSELGKSAALYAGNCFMYMGNFQEAEKYFEKASDASSNLLKEGSFAGIAVCKEASGDLSGAVQFYEKALENITIPMSKIRYQYYMALIYEKNGDKEKAGNLFKMILNENILENKSEFVPFAKSGLVRLGMEIE
jgi:tetratricopeptide (TPR) repeat protein